MRDQEEASNNMEYDMSSVARNDDELLPDDSNTELLTIENNSLFVQIKGLSDAQQLDALRRSQGIAIVSNGNSKPQYDKHGKNFSKMFPDLFPFGRGHPGEHRQVQVSIL